MSEAVPFQQLTDYWIARIQRDLAPFADPNTEVQTVAQGRTIEARWMQRARQRDAVFTVLHDGVTVTMAQRSYSYRGFFASPEMADLTGLAKMILQAHKPRPYVETRAKLDDQEGEMSALTAIRHALNDPSSQDATVIVMITGDAGAGKTSVLQEIVRTQAESYARNQVDSLYLYVNAQGRALARFTEAVAAELDELRSPLTFHEVAPLVRLGLLVPVIDGFDELLGVSGYDEAFSSLSAFVEELDGGGQLIASARSTYYEQEFVSRAGTSSSLGAQIWKQRSVQVLAWGEAELSEYVRKACAERGLTQQESIQALAAVRHAFQGKNESLASKPLFVARTLDLVLLGKGPTAKDDLLEALVWTYLERERSEKLLDRNGNAILTTSQLNELLVELAEEMWNQETRELDAPSIRSVAEYVLATRGVDQSAQKVVVERMPTMAFLARGSRRKTIAFEHETFFACFFGQRLAERIFAQDAPLDVLLGRSILPPDIAHVVAERAALAGVEGERQLKIALERIARAGATSSPRRAQVQENGGRLVQSIIKKACASWVPLKDIRIGEIVIPGGDLKGVHLVGATLKNVEFRRVDLTQTKIERSRGDGVTLNEVVVKLGTTRLEIEGLERMASVYGLRVVEGTSVTSIFDPKEMRTALVTIGAMEETAAPPTMREIPDQVIQLVVRLVRAYGRANPICTSDEFLRGLFQDPSWAAVERHLIRSGVVAQERRETSGKRKTFLRRQVRPEDILAGLNPAAVVPEVVSRFWGGLEAELKGRGLVRG